MESHLLSQVQGSIYDADLILGREERGLIYETAPRNLNC